MNGGRVTVRELRKKRVVSTEDGKVLGRIRDVAFELASGRVLSVKVSRLTGRRVEVEWEKIRLVGEDAVLVEGVTREGESLSGGAKPFVLFE